jgi:NAD(P)-dependent dehydrogenase (short-subunit alcohol dehydrogenase family)
MNGIALVTGANRGIGYDICRQLAEGGFQVLLCSRDVKKGEEVARRLGASVHFQGLDVSDDPSV